MTCIVQFTSNRQPHTATQPDMLHIIFQPSQWGTKTSGMGLLERVEGFSLRECSVPFFNDKTFPWSHTNLRESVVLMIENVGWTWLSWSRASRRITWTNYWKKVSLAAMSRGLTGIRTQVFYSHAREGRKVIRRSICSPHPAHNPYDLASKP